MQFIDLKQQQNRIKNKIHENIDAVLKHGKYILGPEVKMLEDILAKYVGTKYAVGVANGSDALVLALKALDVKEGDAVFVPAFTFFASASAISQVGATPIFVDINETTFNLNIQALETSINAVKKEGKLNPKTVIAVDLFGQLADYLSLTRLAEKYNLTMIEDAAQSMGASQNGRKACAYGDITTTSFFPAKPLGCYGDGGMIFTNNETYYELLMSLRVHGKGKDKYDNVRIGKNSRLDTIQAAILLAKFEIFDDEINKRQQVAAYYSKQLSDFVKTPFIKDGNISAWAQYTVQSEHRNDFVHVLKKENIPTAIYYPKALHQQTAFANLPTCTLPITEKITDTVFSLPFHPYLTKEEQDRIVEVMRKINATLEDK